MSKRPTRAGKLMGALVAALLSLLIAEPAGAAPAPAPSIAAVCANTDAVNPFTDLGGASGEALAAINCLSDLGIVRGTTATTFNPTGNLTRQQAAALIARLGDLLNVNERTAATFTPFPTAAASPDAFVDDEGSTLEDSINRLAAAGIIQGTTTPGVFNPTGLVSRGQFAAFIARLQAYLETGGATSTSSFATTTDFFADDNGSVFERALNELAGQGILRGDGATRSMESAAISRTQGTLIIARLAAVNHAANRIPPLPRPVATNDVIVFTPDDTAIIVDNADETLDNRRYTATGLTAGQSYRVTLVNAGNITRGSDGTITFLHDTGANSGFALATPNAAVDIVEVNGVAVGPTKSILTTPVNGALTVLLDAEGTGRVVPVIYVAPANPNDPNTRLNLDVNGAPTEAFGLGGVLDSRTRQAPA
ncbi:MAG: S-layer homology domain-containing protein, partial [Acidimicrobiia bacterium]|nr:S-layer homology domain-containing protein [Acidimicrobiia bacterium]